MPSKVEKRSIEAKNGCAMRKTQRVNRNKKKARKGGGGVHELENVVRIGLLATKTER